MFPLHQGNELLYQISSSSSTTNQQNNILEDHASLDVSGTNNNNIQNNGGEVARQRRRSLATPLQDNYEMSNNNINDSKKKMMHRDFEKQRRQQMSGLYSSLRSHLPLHYIKGKRSISDHMNEAVNYINHLKMKIKELGVKRDELRKSSALSGSYNDPGILGSNLDNPFVKTCCVMVNSCNWGGVEIMISQCFREEEGLLPLSRVLKILIEEGLIVVSCASTKINERVLYTIQSEAGDLTNIDLSGLQQRLTDGIQSIR